MNSFYRYIVLEQVGPGQSWFDNVIIEKVSGGTDERATSGGRVQVQGNPQP